MMILRHLQPNPEGRRRLLPFLGDEAVDNPNSTIPRLLISPQTSDRVMQEPNREI